MLDKLPSVLQAADWSKKAGDADKKYGIADDLKKLAKLFDQLPVDALDLSGLESEADAETHEQRLKVEYTKAAKQLGDVARAVATEAKKAEGELKKDAKAKAAAAAAGQVASAAQTLVGDVDAAQAKALAELKTLKAKLAAEAKKAEAAAADKAKKDAAKSKDDEEDDADAIAEHKDEKKFREKVKAQLVSWMKRVKAEGAPRAKFTVVVLGKTWGVYLNKSAGESEKKIAMRLAGLSSGFKHCKGEMFYDPKAKAWVFEGPNIPLGRANATSMSLSIKPIIGYAPKLRLQKPGEVGEDSEGADADPDDGDNKQQQAAAGGAPKGPAGVEPAKAFTARMTALQPKILAAANADKLKPLAVQAVGLANKGDVEQAQQLLSKIEDMLGGAQPKPAAPPAGGGSAGGGAGAGGPDAAKVAKLRSDWAGARAAAVRGIEELARTIEQEYRDETDQRAAVADATKKLRALAAQLKDDLEKQLDLVAKAADAAARRTQANAAKAKLTEVLRVVAADPLMKELDGNELMPGLQIVKPMQQTLKEIGAALG